MQTRIINTKIYRDRKFRQLSDKDKFIVIFLLTNEYLEALPIVEIELGLLAFHVTTTEKYLESLIKEKLSYFQVYYMGGFLIIGGLFTYSNYNGGKTKKKKEQLYNELPDDMKEYVDIEGNIAQSLLNALLNDCSTIEHINHKSETINHKSETINREKRKEKAIEKAFDFFWKLYPRKVNRKKAKERFFSILNDCKNLEDTKKLTAKMLQAIKEHDKTEQWSNSTLIPHPTTWLNGRRWEDELNPDEFI